MATTAVHFLTIVGGPADEVEAACDALIATRSRVVVDAPDDFEDVAAADLRYSWSYRDEQVINTYCRDLLDAAHRLPTLYYSQFVHNFTGPRRLVHVLPPPGDPLRVVSSLNFVFACYSSVHAARTLAAIDAGMVQLGEWPEEARVDYDGRAYLDHLRIALTQPAWLGRFTVVVLEQCIDGTREDFEIKAAMAAPLGIAGPAPFTARPGVPEDRDALLALWRRGVSDPHAAGNDVDADGPSYLVRDDLFAKLLIEVLLTAEGLPVGYVGRAERTIKALFVDPAHRRRGGGRLLVEQAAFFCYPGVSADVNEADADARAFFERVGFVVIGRSESDARGRPTPVLHLRRGK